MKKNKLLSELKKKRKKKYPRKEDETENVSPTQHGQSNTSGQGGMS